MKLQRQIGKGVGQNEDLEHLSSNMSEKKIQEFHIQESNAHYAPKKKRES